MAGAAPGSGMTGRQSYTRLGLVVAVIAFLVDQGYKWWMLEIYGIAGRGHVTVTPFLDLVLLWNKGISYGLFPQDSMAGQFVLLAVKFVIVAVLLVWLTRVTQALVAVAVGLVVGGALGNALDRIVHGAVADFFSFHAYGFYWYVFNLADIAIVAGVALLLYDSLTGARLAAE